MNTKLEFTLNGQSRSLSVDPRRSLLDVLREDLGLTGTKFGCGEGDCRACTVLIDEKPTASCLTEISAVKSRQVETIEALARGDTLHPIQEAFIAEGAIQCGYCIPGMIMATAA